LVELSKGNKTPAGVVPLAFSLREKRTRPGLPVEKFLEVVSKTRVFSANLEVCGSKAMS